MFRKEEKIDEDEFQVVLSKEDYEELKGWKEKYRAKKEELEKRIEEVEVDRNRVSEQQKFSVLENGQLRKEKQEIEQLVGRMYSDLQDKKQKIVSDYDGQLSFLNIKRPDQTILTKDKSLSITEKLNVSIELMQKLFDSFELVVQKQGEKVDNLVKETIRLKQQNFKLNVQLSQNNEKFRTLQQQGQQRQQYLQRQRMEIEKLMHSIESLEQTHQLQLAKINDQSLQQCQQLLLLKKKLSSLQHQNEFLGKQLTLTQQQNVQFRKQTNDLQDEIKQYQQHILLLKQSIQLSSRQKEQLKKPPSKTKFQKQDYIKETLIEYMRQIRKNLISIGNLSQEEIRQIGTSELRTLVKFIQELQEDFE